MLETKKGSKASNYFIVLLVSPNKTVGFSLISSICSFFLVDMFRFSYFLRFGKYFIYLPDTIYFQ